MPSVLAWTDCVTITTEPDTEHKPELALVRPEPEPEVGAALPGLRSAREACSAPVVADHLKLRFINKSEHH